MILMLAICLALLAGALWLLRRCWMPPIPEQLGYYGPGIGARLGVTAMVVILLAVAAGAALNHVWLIWSLCCLCTGLYLWLFGRDFRVIAWSEELLVVQRLTGAPSIYRWEDVSACSIRQEQMRGRGLTYRFDMYCLTLPDQEIGINSGEDAGVRFLQALARRRPDLKACREPKK